MSDTEQAVQNARPLNATQARALAMSTWEPVAEEEAMSIIGEGLHTGLRKGSDAPEAASLWRAISDSDDAWHDGLGYLVWGLEQMGMALCRKVGN